MTEHKVKIDESEERTGKPQKEVNPIAALAEQKEEFAKIKEIQSQADKVLNYPMETAPRPSSVDRS